MGHKRGDSLVTIYKRNQLFLLWVILYSTLKILAGNIIFCQNFGVEYSSLRVKTLDGHQISIFEARVLASNMDLHYIYIKGMV